MNEKMRKTLYLQPWIIQILDFEGEKYDGPGIVAMAAIYNFSLKKIIEKKAILREYRAKEIEFAYLDESAAAQKSEVPLHIQKKSKTSRFG